jgi:hypothetical protein
MTSYDIGIYVKGHGQEYDCISTMRTLASNNNPVLDYIKTMDGIKIGAQIVQLEINVAQLVALGITIAKYIKDRNTLRKMIIFVKCNYDDTILRSLVEQMSFHQMLNGDWFKQAPQTDAKRLLYGMECNPDNDRCTMIYAAVVNKAPMRPVCFIHNTTYTLEGVFMSDASVAFSSHSLFMGYRLQYLLGDKNQVWVIWGMQGSPPEQDIKICEKTVGSKTLQRSDMASAPLANEGNYIMSTWRLFTQSVRSQINKRSIDVRTCCVLVNKDSMPPELDFNTIRSSNERIVMDLLTKHKVITNPRLLSWANHDIYSLKCGIIPRSRGSMICRMSCIQDSAQYSELFTIV